MSRKLTNKERFIRILSRDKYYRGKRPYTLYLYRKFLTIINKKGYCNATDLFEITSVRNPEFFIRRGFTAEEASEKINQIQSRGFNNMPYEKVKRASAKRKQTFSKKTEEEIKNINFKRGLGYNPEYVAKKYDISIDEAERRIEERKQKKVRSYKEHLKSIGGHKKEWSCRCAEYWAKRGYSDEEIKNALKYKFDTRSIESIMYRLNLSEEEAKKKQDEIAEKCRKTFNARPDSEKKEILVSRTKFFKYYSKSSKKFFDKIWDLIKKLNLTMLYGENEYFLWYKDSSDKKNRIYFYDCFIPEIDLIIEYNGIIFHPREKDTWACTVTESISKDNFKKALAETHGYKVIYVWDNEEEEVAINRVYNIIIDRYDNRSD